MRRRSELSRAKATPVCCRCSSFPRQAQHLGLKPYYVVVEQKGQLIYEPNRHSRAHPPMFQATIGSPIAAICEVTPTKLRNHATLTKSREPPSSSTTPIPPLNRIATGQRGGAHRPALRRRVPRARQHPPHRQRPHRAQGRVDGHGDAPVALSGAEPEDIIGVHHAKGPGLALNTATFLGQHLHFWFCGRAICDACE